MSSRTYAVPADYQTYTSQTPTADTPRQLSQAGTMLEASVFRYCYYDSDPVTGMPTDPNVAAAFRDAVCAQVEWWTAVGDQIGIGGIGTYDQVHIGTVRLMSSKSIGNITMSAARQVAPKAIDALQSLDVTPDIFRFGLVVSM
jgi:hypothetical protein